MSRPPDWDCPDCGNRVFGSKKECGKCGKWRSKINNSASVAKKSDWNCACGELNFASRGTCRKCSQNKPAELSVAKKPGDWNCACGELNFGSRNVCRKCSVVKPNSNPPPVAKELTCIICMERPIETTLPCGHVALCSLCAHQTHACPLCRQPYSEADIKRAFVAV